LGYELKCHPDAEAEVYKAARDNDIWSHLSKIKCNISLLAGEKSDVYTERAMNLKNLHAQFKYAKYIESATIPNTGHFIPLERPDIIAAHVYKVIISRSYFFLTIFVVLRQNSLTKTCG
jgi:pimeloyl-ACP methyl ester carboxylesterase